MSPPFLPRQSVAERFARIQAIRRRLSRSAAARYPAPMTDIPTPYVDTEAEQPDSEQLATLYEARAGQMEQEAADARSPAQAEGLRLGAGSFRRKAAAMRKRLNP
jgi:hypothetical protein